MTSTPRTGAVATMTKTTPLSVLLVWAEPLYKTSSSSSSNLSLMQLISVHQSLLQAVRQATGAFDTNNGAADNDQEASSSSDNDNDALMISFRPWCSSKAEALLCARILEDPTVHLGTYLLAIQYLFMNTTRSGKMVNDSKTYDEKKNDAAASELWWAIWKFWEEKNPRFRFHQKGGEAVETKQYSSPSTTALLDPQEMETFLQAVVQVVLSSTTTDVTEISKWMDRPADLESSSLGAGPSEWYWHRTTLLFVEWVKRTASATSKELDQSSLSELYKEVFRQLVSFLEKTLLAAWKSLADEPWKIAAGWYRLPKWSGWKALTQLLLPALVDLLEEDSFASSELAALLWKSIWTFKNDTQVSTEDQPVLLLVVTTVLSPIWPYLVKQEQLPSVVSGTQESIPLIEQADVWSFLKQCLHQGIDTLTAQSSLDQKGTTALLAITTLVRRRGLFLLRTLVADRQECKEWRQYVACFETLEMEEDKHLVLQVWSTVGDLMSSSFSREESPVRTPPDLSTDWLLLLLGHALTSATLPFLRKENLYRFFRGQTGIIVPNIDNAKPPTKSTKKKVENTGAPLALLPLNFVFNIVLPAYDTIEQSVGLHVHWIVNGKTEKYDVAAAFDHFFAAYMESILQKNSEGKWLGPWLASKILVELRAKTLTTVLKHLADVLDGQKWEGLKLLVDNDDLNVIARNFRSLFDTGRVVPVHRESIYESFGIILTHARIVGNPNAMAVLTMLNLFPYPRSFDDDRQHRESHWMDIDPVFKSLGSWIHVLVEDSPSWASDVPSTLASAYVDNVLAAGVNRKEEKLTGRSIVFLCVLVANQGLGSTASQLLWPAINKGLSLTPSALLSASSQNAVHVQRALVLLEHGCKVEVLSGNGNGDLVVDRKTEQMMPPPPSIETLLAHAVSFLHHTIKFLLSVEEIEKNSSRSRGSRALSAAFAGHLETLRTLSQAYPSSTAVSEAANEYLRMGLEEIAKQDKLPFASIQYFALIFAALCCGADMNIDIDSICRTILTLEVDETQGIREALQPIRAIFAYSRWGSLSKLVPRLVDSNGGAIFNEILEAATSEVRVCPSEALMPLFETALATGKYLVHSAGGKEKQNFSNEALLHLDRLIQLLSKIMADCDKRQESLYVIDESSRLIFQSSLLLDEYRRLKEDPRATTPSLSTFRKLVKSAGTKRPHIVRTVLSRVIPSWMENELAEPGLLAIPYREDIVNLLMYKPDRIEVSAMSHAYIQSTEDLKSQIPQSTHGLSLVRAFVLFFLSSLPDASRICEEVRQELSNFIILNLLRKVKFGKGSNLPMIGTPGYCSSLRGWQALCILSRFVGEDIASEVCGHVFEAMEDQLHGQIRFFLEVFTIQCARKYPLVFGDALCKQMTRHDLHLQMVTSLMIVSGHLVVGKYKEEFIPYTSSEKGGLSPISIDQLLAGSLPWLSSTQGFSRAIAQIMVHALIPMVIDTSKKREDEANWYIRSTYDFLETNEDMTRLRKKQQKFFGNMDVDSYCTLEGCLSMAVDNVGETNPKHLIEVMKAGLQEVYKESHGADAPAWKQVQSLIEEADDEEDCAVVEKESLVNFQRKIIPLDALNIALDDQRDKRLRNMAGRRRQPLIVCASLVDKVPNLGGLARTCEIFAADRMVLPDRSVIKMDNFTSISVSASDWIEIEECAEKDLLGWLRAKKTEGWYIVGIEQTSSSMSMADFEFPNRPTILLLGKEKEGIPVQYLQAVDQCVEIPQLGIIRSLNVHVSGALAIWEFTRQRMGKQ